MPIPLPQTHWGCGCLEPVTTIFRQKFASRQSAETRMLVPRDRCPGTSHLWFSQSSRAPCPTGPDHGPLELCIPPRTAEKFREVSPLPKVAQLPKDHAGIGGQVS